jgi:hypothetical protein
MLHTRRVAALPAYETPPTHESRYTAVVHASDGVRFLAAARRPDELAARVADYVSERCDDALWPSDARRVHQLIDQRCPYAAIALYFSNIGNRWDVEHLELGGLSFGSE